MISLRDILAKRRPIAGETVYIGRASLSIFGEHSYTKARVVKVTATGQTDVRRDDGAIEAPLVRFTNRGDKMGQSSYENVFLDFDVEGVERELKRRVLARTAEAALSKVKVSDGCNVRWSSGTMLAEVQRLEILIEEARAAALTYDDHVTGRTVTPSAKEAA